jgi:hypothetical protein
MDDLAAGRAGLVQAEEGSDRLTVDRLALIQRWAEVFGLDLESGIEAAMATQEADHVAELVDAAVAAANPRPVCTCAAADDVDPWCAYHFPKIGDDDLRALLPAARSALTWAVGARTNVYHDDPARTRYDGMLVNVIVAVLTKLREPSDVDGRRGQDD